MVVKQSNDLDWALNTIANSKSRYLAVEEDTDVPWYFVAALHYMESSLDFRRNLHNGEPWNAVTTRVPSGRGPFKSWHDSAVDALKCDGLFELMPLSEWTFEDMLKWAESYNGEGYYRRGVMSPYVWSWTQHYTGGLYLADHVYFAHKKQMSGGVAAIMSELCKREGITLKRL
jgi:lysozyme family protein